MESITKCAMQELDDEALGWYRHPMPYGTNAMLCRASLTSVNLGVAIKRWCNHHNLIVDDVHLQLSSDGSKARFTVEKTTSLGDFTEFCLISILRNIQGYSCWLIDSCILLDSAGFAFPEPLHRDAYDTIFDCVIEFGAATTYIEFDARYLSLGLRRDDAALRLMLERPLPLVVLRYRHDRLLTQRVRDLIRENTARPLTADSIAYALGTSVRGLYRCLANEGTSLQSLKDEVRCKLAIGLLRQTQRPISQISNAVGFSSQSSFERAFKRWTGASPTEYRQ